MLAPRLGLCWKNTAGTGNVQERAAEMVHGLEKLLCCGRQSLSRLNFSCKRSLRGGLTMWVVSACDQEMSVGTERSSLAGMALKAAEDKPWLESSACFHQGRELTLQWPQPGGFLSACCLWIMQGCLSGEGSQGMNTARQLGHPVLQQCTARSKGPSGPGLCHSVLVLGNVQERWALKHVEWNWESLSLWRRGLVSSRDF